MDIARKTAVACSVALCFLAGLWLLDAARLLILLLLVAAIIAIAVEPLVARLQRLGLKRQWGALLSFLAIIVVVFLILAAIITPLAQQGIALSQNLPGITAGVLQNPTLAGLNEKFHFADEASKLSADASAIFQTGGASALSLATGAAALATDVTLIVIIAYLLQIEGGELWMACKKLVPRSRKANVDHLGKEIMRAISGYVSGNLFISLIAGGVTLATLLILRVPYAFALAALVALFDLIPMVGAALATVVVALVALTQGWIVAVIAVAILLAYQFIEGHFIQPIVYAKSVELSALVIILASILGEEIGGIVGILLAIPAASVLQIIAKEAYGAFRRS